MLNVRCWMFDVGCWMLDVGCWVLDVGCWMLDVGCWMLDVGYSMFDLLSPISALRSPPGRGQGWVIPHSAFRTPHSTVQWAFHSQPRLLHDVSIDLRRRHVHVSEQILHRPDIRSRLQQTRRESKNSC